MKLLRCLALGFACVFTLPALAEDYIHTNFNFSQQEVAGVDTLVILVPEDTESLAFAGWSRAASDQVNRAMRTAEFNGAKDAFLEVLAPVELAADRVLLVGVGDLAELKRTDAEKLGAALANRINASKADQVAVNKALLTSAPNASLLVASMAHGVDLRNYRFDKYKSEPDARPSQTYTWVASEQTEQEYKQLAALAKGVFLAREFTNEPGSSAYPEKFVERAMSLADLGIEITVLNPEQIKEMGMGALYGVGRGSQQGPRLLVMHWKGSDDAPIALVGKGNTFDTGGYNLKTNSASIRRMITDLAGGAAVVGAMKALAGQEVPLNVVGVVPLTQNMISGHAQLPGDVVTAGNGKTIEIGNTDAEGRLILADGLWYAKSQFEPRVMIDIATLTGAKVGALGTAYSAVFSDHDELIEQLRVAGDNVDEPVWQLPMHPSYKSSIISDKADYINIGSPGASAGAMLLREFVGEVPWVHIDMAGNALGSDQGIHPAGGTGYGVRLLTEWVKGYAE